MCVLTKSFVTARLVRVSTVCPLSFPSGGTVSYANSGCLGLHCLRTPVQSLGPHHELDITLLGGKLASCPILSIFTIPKFVSWPAGSFEASLGRRGSKGFLEPQGVLHLRNVLVSISQTLAVGSGSGESTMFFPTERARISMDNCFSALVTQF